MAINFHKKNNNESNDEKKVDNIVSDDIYKDYIPKEEPEEETYEEEHEEFKQENNVSNQGKYYEKQYKSGFLSSHTKVAAASTASRILLVMFYLIVIIIGAVVFFMLKTDKYQFYFKNDEVIVNKGSIYQVEIVPKNASSFDYLNYNYKIGDESVATVDEYGTVKVIGAGKTDLSVSMKYGLASKKMTIVSEDINIESIDLKVYKKDKMLGDTVVDMVTDETVTLHACANGIDEFNLSVDYSSSNPDVAVVDEFGNVTAKKSGKTVITGTRDGLSGSITIRVTVNNTSTSKPSNPTPKPGTQTNTPKPGTQMSTPKPSNPTPKPEIQSISFTSNKVSIKQGASLQLSLDVIPSSLSNSTFTWSSNNTNVSVDKSGRITGNNVGTSIITARSSNGKTATCEVSVTTDTIYITSIKLSKTTLPLKVGHSHQLIASIEPSNATERDLTWSTSNSNVAMVTNGLVTALSKGEATITIKTKNGLSSSCKVTVSEGGSSTKLTSVDIGIVETTKYVGETLQLTAKLTPQDAKVSKISWRSNDTSVATVSSNGLVTTKKAGTVTITVNVDGLESSGRIIVKNKSVSTPKPTTPKPSTPPATIQPTTPQPATPKPTTPKPSSPMGDNYMKISTDSISVSKGGTKTFTISVSNAIGSVKVQSSNTSIATVDQSLIFFDGIDSAGNIKADTQTITVTGKAQGTTKIKIIPDDLATFDTLKALTTTYTMDVTVN